jgi:hypothetical protein
VSQQFIQLARPHSCNEGIDHRHKLIQPGHDDSPFPTHKPMPKQLITCLCTKPLRPLLPRHVVRPDNSSPNPARLFPPSPGCPRKVSSFRSAHCITNHSPSPSLAVVLAPIMGRVHSWLPCLILWRPL